MACFSGRSAYDRILSYIEKAKAAGGEILVGGNGKSVRVRLWAVYREHLYHQGTIPRVSSFSRLSS